MSKKKKKQQQPKIKKGRTFTGWATFNWGISHNRVYPTRKAAKEHLLGWVSTSRETTWDEVKKYCRIEKVKVTVI